MPKKSSAIRAAVLSAVILAVLMNVSPVAYADVRNQDPGGGGSTGGGVTCVTQHCAFCGTACNQSGTSCWKQCFYLAQSGACSCLFENGECSGNGSCTYVP